MTKQIAFLALTLAMTNLVMNAYIGYRKLSDPVHAQGPSVLCSSVSSQPVCVVG